MWVYSNYTAIKPDTIHPYVFKVGEVSEGPVISEESGQQEAFTSNLDLALDTKPE